MASDYEHGTMNISAQKNTFDGIMSVTVWSSALLMLGLFYFVLVFAVGNDWLSTLMGVSVLGLILGPILGLKASWYFTVAGTFVFGLVTGGIAMLFGAFLAG